MNEHSAVVSGEEHTGRAVFISYATSDRKAALTLCKAIERRGTKCWISTRDVAPGENYQEAIVRAIRASPAIVLVFSQAANESDEIKKELSLASRYRVPVMALRIEDVEPSDAFAYELSTRQWIDAFQGWDRSLDALAGRLREVAAAEPPMPTPSGGRGSQWRTGRAALLAIAVAMLLLAAGGLIWATRRSSTPAATQTIQVRLASFETLSAGVPSGMPDSIRDEIIAAFNADGLVTVSTAPSPPPGNSPSYALGGSIRSEAGGIRIIARLINERSGVTLWSNSFAYTPAEVARAPRRIAIDAGNVVRCGLFGAATYAKQLPDPVLADYLQFCHYTNLDFVFSKALYFSRKTVTAQPDFSWGWSAVEKSAVRVMRPKSPDPIDPLRAEAQRAAAKALRLDPSNSEALVYESLLADSSDLSAREGFLQQALKARPLACGCEHHTYGNFLLEVGRIGDAATEFRRSVDVLAFYNTTQVELGAALLQLGRPADAKPHFEAAAELDPDPYAAQEITVLTTPVTHDYAAAITALRKPGFPQSRAATAALAAFEAMQSGNAPAKSRAIAALEQVHPTALTIALLGALGAGPQALQKTQAAAEANIYGARGWLFLPTMDAARRDASFTAVAQRLGLIRYWRSSHTRPTACTTSPQPPFCRLI